MGVQHLLPPPPVQQFLAWHFRDIKYFKETRKEFDRGSESLGSALHHNAEVPRRRHHEAEEAMVALKAARTTFRARALDYVLQVRVGRAVPGKDWSLVVQSFLCMQENFWVQSLATSSYLPTKALGNKCWGKSPSVRGPGNPGLRWVHKALGFRCLLDSVACSETGWGRLGLLNRCMRQLQANLAGA